MRPADRFSVAYIGDVHPRARDMLQFGTGALQGGGDVVEGLDGLRVGIALAHHRAVRVDGGRAGDVYDLSDAHGP